MKYKKITEDPIYLSILSYIKEKGIVHPSELASVYDITRQAIDHRIKNLEIEGLVKKEYVEGKVYIVISEKGNKILEEKLFHEKKKICRPSLIKLNLDILTLILFVILGLAGFTYFTIYRADYIRGSYSFSIWIIIGLIIYLYLFKRRKS